ncbi:hypothetical protein D3C87_1499040 [compost metagenome]
MCNGRRQFNGFAGIQEQHARTARQHILHRAGVFVAGCEPHHRDRQPPTQIGLCPGDIQNGRRVAAIGMQPLCIADAVFDRLLRGAYQRQVIGDTRGFFGKQPGAEAFLQHILRHGAVRGPFAARNGHQTTAAGQHGVLPTEGLGVVSIVILRLHQGAQADPDAADICDLGRAGEVAR